MHEKRMLLTPINPFSQRQREIIELKAQGLSRKQIAASMGLTESTISAYISGVLNAEPGSKVNLGILGIIEKVTGSRPGHGAWLQRLFGDVLLISDVDDPDPTE